MSKLFSKSLNGVKVPHSKNTAEMENCQDACARQGSDPMKQHMAGAYSTVQVTDLVKVGQIMRY